MTIVIKTKDKCRIRYMLQGIQNWYTLLQSQILVTVGARATRSYRKGGIRPVGPKFEGIRVWVEVPGKFTTESNRRSFAVPRGYSAEQYAVAIHTYIQQHLDRVLPASAVLEDLSSTILQSEALQSTHGSRIL